MDEQVLHAMRRWPDVPAVSGWLSLDRRGAWRLHEHGGANEGEPGVAIAHAGMIAFINRNYASDAQGRWYFQNGPQRVYVTLAAAPLVLRRDDGGLGLETHTGQPVDKVHAWWLDQHGALYASLDGGFAVVDDRDLASCASRLRQQDGSSMLEAWDAWEKWDATLAPTAAASLTSAPIAELSLDGAATPAPLRYVDAAALPGVMGYVLKPQA